MVLVGLVQSISMYVLPSACLYKGTNSLTLTFPYCCFVFLGLGSQIHGFGSIDLKSMQAENSRNVIPPTSRSSNSIALRFCNYPLDSTVRIVHRHIAINCFFFPSSLCFHLNVIPVNVNILPVISIVCHFADIRKIFLWGHLGDKFNV